MKKIVILAIATVLVLSTGVALAGGPVAKATGTVGLGEPVVGWYARFNAHEEMDSRPAKGRMQTWNVTSLRELHYYVKHVVVDDDTAWFAAQCISDSGGVYDGQWLFVKVVDGGTPGAAGDEIGWDWSSGMDETDAAERVRSEETPDHWWGVVIDGNLVVHTYE